jgi:cold shock CspA family protein/ribosome-associated translation inhibitor RaiA
MEVPLQLTQRDVPGTRQAEVEERVRKCAARLERFHDRIVSCRVAVERPHLHERSGNPYRVRVEVSVPPGHDVVATSEPGDFALHDDLLTVINRTFEAVERQVKELADRQQGAVKTHHEPLALVVRLFHSDGYGFLKTLDGRDVYFHRNSAAEGWEGLEIGAQVRFAETMGEMGPQATTVQRVDNPGAVPASPPERSLAEPLGWERRERE